MAAFKVEICGVNTAKLPLLSAQEKTELLKMIKEGDRQARDKYIKGNLRLVLSVVQRFSGSNENMDDLFRPVIRKMIPARRANARIKISLFMRYLHLFYMILSILANY